MEYGPSSEAMLEDPSNQGYVDKGSATEDPDPKSEDASNDEFWLKRARSSYEASESWFDGSVRRRMEESMALFNSEHPPGSKYLSAAYDKRSKLFRPKSRAGMRKIEASAAAAFFATQDVLTTTPPNPNDKMQRGQAEAMSELLNYRLTHNIPWFITCLGGLQDAGKQGVVISKQHWVWREVTEGWEEDVLDDETGEVVDTRNVLENRVLADHPDILLRPAENILFSPAADWRNPLQSSPYLIDMEPFYVDDIIQRGKHGPQGPFEVPWRKLTKEQIRSTSKRHEFDSIRQQREGRRQDRYSDTESFVEEFDTVWVHHNYVRVEGQDWYFASLGTDLILSDPVPLEETTPLGERPYTMGFCVLETHKPYPASLMELGRGLQEETNDTTNLRIENIRHVISPRYFIKRGTSVDIRSLLRNVPGGVTAMEDPKNDVNIRQIADTTRSSYEEQDRLSVEFDELVGTTSQSGIAANHNINERVGNAMMLNENANQLTEMTLRMLVETWVEPTLQQIMELERTLESDAMVLAIVGQRVNTPPDVIFRRMDMPVQVRVNVGFGATNPQFRLNKVSMAFQTLGQIAPNLMQRVDEAELANEVLGAVGYKSVERFFPGLGGDGKQDPQVQQLMQENEQLKAMLESEGLKFQSAEKIAQIRAQSAERQTMAKLQYQQQRDRSADQIKLQIENNKMRIALLEVAISQEESALRKQEMVNERQALQHTIAMDEYQLMLAERELAWEMGQPRNPNTGPTAVDNAPESSEVKPKELAGPRIASSPDLGAGGEDRAGVLARDRYGTIPFEEG